jgi:hypothetical protein
MDLAAARDKLVEYTAKNLSIFVAEDDQSSLAGYLVCRVDGEVVWVEFLFTAPEYRRQEWARPYMPKQNAWPRNGGAASHTIG